MSMECLRGLFAAALLVPGMVAAQSAIGSDCSALDDGGGQQSFMLSAPVAAGQWIVVSVAANAAGMQFATDPVTDSAGNSYPIYGVVLMPNSSGVLATFAGRAATALNAGDEIAVHYDASGSATAQSCVEAAAFPGVALLDDPSDGYGQSSGFDSMPTVTIGLPTQYADELVYSAFASAGTPGAMTAQTPAQGLGQVCSGDGTLCLLPAWNYGASVAGIDEGADSTSANSTAWGALAITFQSNDRIFADGFDGN
jgi:hypothetical protein